MTDLTTLLSLAELLPKEDIKECTQPFSIFSQETSDLSKIAAKDAPMLTAKGLPQATIDNLPLWAQLVQGTQSDVKSVASENKELQHSWNTQYKGGLTLKKEIFENEEFAYFGDELTLGLLDDVSEGDDYADTIEDLHVLSKIGKDNPEPLLAIGFDMALLDEAETVANQLTELRSELNSLLYQSSEATIKRDQVFTLAKRDVVEVRRVGKFVFRHDPEHAKLYSSQYDRKRSAEYRRRKKEDKSGE